MGAQGGGIDQADDHHRRGRALLGAAWRALRRALLRHELSLGAPGGPARGAPRTGGRARGGGGVILSVKGLRKTHGARPVLRGIDAEVAAGETIALVGPSGGGKSTFLRCLNGLDFFDAGEVRIAGLS